MLFPYLGSNGASLQDADGRFTFASPEGEAAIGYLVDLVNKDHVAPSAADTNDLYNRQVVLRCACHDRHSCPRSRKEG